MVPADFTPPTGKDHWHVLLRARAIENQVYVVAAAQIGETLPGKPAYGRSLIADPWGVVIAQAPDEETVIAAELDRAHLRTFAPSCRRSRTGSRTRTGGRRESDACGLARARPDLVARVSRSGGCNRRTVGARGRRRRGSCGVAGWPTAVLKLTYPYRESEHEADALALWDGHGEGELLARDDGVGNVVERCEPVRRSPPAEPDVYSMS